MLSWQFIVNSSVEFVVFKVWNFSPAWWQKHGVTGIFRSSQALTNAAGRARMQEMWKACHLKIYDVFCFSSFLCFGDFGILSMASSFTRTIDLSKSHDVCMYSVKRPSYSHFLKAALIHLHRWPVSYHFHCPSSQASIYFQWLERRQVEDWSQPGHNSAQSTPKSLKLLNQAKAINSRLKVNAYTCTPV